MADEEDSKTDCVCNDPGKPSVESQTSNVWVTFEECKDQDVKPFPEPPLASNSLNSEHYLLALEKRLKKVQGKGSTGLSSRDMLKSLEQAKVAHMGQMMASKQSTEAYILEEDMNNRDKCFPVHRLLSPKQPVSREEHEWLVDTEADG